MLTRPTGRTMTRENPCRIFPGGNSQWAVGGTRVPYSQGERIPAAQTLVSAPASLRCWCSHVRLHASRGVVLLWQPFMHEIDHHRSPSSAIHDLDLLLLPLRDVVRESYECHTGHRSHPEKKMCAKSYVIQISRGKHHLHPAEHIVSTYGICLYRNI